MANDTRIPNPHSPEEVRRAFAVLRRKNDIIDDGALGEVLVGVAVGTLPEWGTELTALTKITIDNITIDGAVISSDSGAISFADENLTTTGWLKAGNITINAATILSGTGAISFGDENLSTTGSITGGSLIVDNITIDAATILSDTGAISFGDENLTTTGTVAGVNVTSGNDPGHTHTERFFHNGTFWESFNALVSSDGATITLTLQQSPTGDLTMQFSDGVTVLDCTSPAQTIVLTAGADDSSPQANYIFIPQSTKILTKSTSSWPATEHIKVAYCLVPSATFVNDHAGPYVNQNWNDFLQGTDSQGHLSHIAKKIRRLGASWFSGVNADGGSVSYFTIGSGTTKWISTVGVVMQLHEQTFPIVNMPAGDLAIVVNDNSAAYTHVTDLFSITQDNTGTPIQNNRYFNLVFWGVMNKTGDWSGIMVNLPGGFYTKQSDAEVDANNLDVYSIPREFSIDSGTAFLIARVTFQMGGTWSHASTVDLRGLTPATASGSSVNDHGGLGGLLDDDHTQYLLVDGSRQLSGDWTTGVHSIIGSDHWYMRADSKKLFLGTADDGSIYYDGANLVFDCQEVGAGDCRFISGDVGIGDASADLIEGKLAVSQTSIDTAAVTVGVNVNCFYGASGSGNTAVAVYGLRFNAQTESDYDGDSTSSFEGIHGVVNHRGSGTLSGLYGAQFELYIRSGGGDVTSAYGVAIRFSDASSVGEFVNCYGIYVRDVNVGTATNFAIYTNDGYCYFKDRVGIGTTLPVEQFQVVGNMFLSTNYKLIMGSGKRSAIYYDGTDMILSPRDGGASGNVLIGPTANMLIDAGSYSVAGVAGVSGTFTTVDGKTVTVVNGIITVIV